MKILILSHAAGNPEIGPNMRTFYLARHLAKLGHSVDIVGSGNFHKYKETPLKDKKYTQKTIEGIHYHWLPTFNYDKRNYQQVLNQLSFVFQLYKFRDTCYKLNPDIVLVSSPHPFGIYIGNKIAKKINAKLIFEIRDLWPEIISELGGFKNTHPYMRMINHAVKKAYKLSDGVVSVKPGDLNYIKQKYNVKGTTAYIPNGFDHIFVLDEYYTAPVFNEAGFKIIYTGALSSYYAMEYLLFAAEKLKNSHPDIKIIIVGDGENKLDLEKIKEEKKLTNVTFLGHLPKKNMLSVIRQADLAYLGLRYTKANQFGISTNKLFEYMYAKKIVLASYSTDYDLIKEAHFGYTVSPECSEAIYDAIVKVYNLKSMERKELGENGYKYLLKHHTFEKIAADYIKFFKNILQ